jgi:hypothetical protein
MKVVVMNGYVTVGSVMYGEGAEIDLPEGIATNLLMDGAVAVPEMMLHVDEQENSDTEDNKQDGENSDTEETDLDPIELPSVDPAAAAKKTRGKKA